MDVVTEAVNLLVNNGIAVCVTAYFLFRDYRYQEKLVETLTSIKDAVVRLNKEGEEE